MLAIISQTLLNTVVERTPKIEKVNVDGGRFIREAKVTSYYTNILIGLEVN